MNLRLENGRYVLTASKSVQAFKTGNVGEELDYEDIEDAAECLINDIPYAGFGEK